MLNRIAPSASRHTDRRDRRTGLLVESLEVRQVLTSLAMIAPGPIGVRYPPNPYLNPGPIVVHYPPGPVVVQYNPGPIDAHFPPGPV
jgi:hypothetical protein